MARALQQDHLAKRTGTHEVPSGGARRWRWSRLTGGAGGRRSLLEVSPSCLLASSRSRRQRKRAYNTPRPQGPEPVAAGPIQNARDLNEANMSRPTMDPSYGLFLFNTIAPLGTVAVALFN